MIFKSLLPVAVLCAMGLGAGLYALEPADNPSQNSPPPPLIPTGEEPPLIVPKQKIDPTIKPIPQLPDPKPVEPTDEKLPKIDDFGPAKPAEQLWIAPRNGELPGQSVRVGFYNHTDRELALEIDGNPVVLPSLHYLLLKRSRAFAWRQKEGELHKVAVPADADGVELIFRK